MALYVKSAGGNASAAGTWSNISSLGADNSGPPTSADDCIADLNSGQLTIDAATSMKSFSATDGVGDYANTITHNAFNWTVAGNFTLVAGMTYTPLATSTLTLSATSALTSAGKLFPLISVTGGTTTLADNLSFMASKVLTFKGTGTFLALNGKTVSGNSATNRILIQGVTLGTAATITNTTGTFANADFRDITFSAVADYSAITGNSGDCGGNTNGTFTTAATQTYTGGTGNWSTGASWTSRVPLPQDNVLMSGVTGGTITADMPRLGKSIDWTGAGGSPTWALSTASQTVYGSITLISAMTNTQSNTMIFEGRGSFTLTSAGQVWSSVQSFAMVGGTMTLQDALINNGGSGNIALQNGTFTSNGFNVTCKKWQQFTNNTTVLNMGSSTFTIQSTSGNSWDVTATGNTTNAGTSTIVFTDTGASSKSFLGAGLTYNNLSISGGGAGAVIITGANSFARPPQITGGTKLITLPGSKTTTFLQAAGLGNGANVITFTASAESATVSVPGGVVDWKSVNLTNIIATGGAIFYAGAAPPSVNGGGNTGWIFANAPPSGISGSRMMMGIGT